MNTKTFDTAISPPFADRKIILQTIFFKQKFISMKKYLLILTAFLLSAVTIYAQPTITSFAPTSGPVGTEVTITGTNFSNIPANNIVYFGAVKTSVTAATTITLKVNVPAGATYQPITVTTNGLTSYSANPFIVTFEGGGGGIDPGSFSPKFDIDTELLYYPQNIVSGDIDGDGKPDLITANWDPPAFSVFRNTTTDSNAAFADRIDFPTYGNENYNLALGDFDGDGRLDIAILEAYSLIVFRNTSSPGSISFTHEIRYFYRDLDDISNGIAVGDMNIDGKPDIVIGIRLYETGQNQLIVYENKSSNGTITFSPSAFDAVYGSPNDISICDFDGDSKPDLTVAYGNYGSNTIGVFRNNTSGELISFAQPLQLVQPGSANQITSGDLDGDGKADLILSNLSIFRNKSTSGVLNFELDTTLGASATSSVAIADINGDGNPDIASTSSSGVVIHENKSVSGKLQFGNAVEFKTDNCVRYARLCDLNSDGKTDIATLNWCGESSVSVLKNQVNPVIVTPTITSFSPTSGHISSTVTINGTNFSSNPNENIVYFGVVRAVVAEATTTTLKVYVPVGTTYEPITVTVNGLIAYSAKPFVVTFAGGGVIDENSFASAVDLQMGSNPDQMAVADIDGDSRTDLIVGSYGTSSEPQNAVNIFRNTSTPSKITFAPKVQLMKGSGQTYPLVADFDGDGKIDLAVMDSRLETLTLFINKSTPGYISLAQQAVYATGDFPYSIAKADIDGDGKTDIVIPNLNGKNFSVYRNTSTLGSISFDTKIDFTLPLQPLSIAIGDLDKDKKADLVIGYNEYNNYVVSVFKNTSTSGAVSFDAAIDLPNVADGYTSGINIGDLDGDGKPDLAVSNFSNSASTISLFRNTGNHGVISFAPKVRFSTKGEGFQNNAVTDFDGDGKPDITGGNYWSGNTAVFKNTSSPGKLSLAEAVIYPAGSGTKASTSVDIDGDGKPDIVFLNLFSGTISILRNLIADNGCTPPANLNVTNITSSSARLIWSLQDTAATSFEIRYRAVGNLTWLYRKADGVQKGITLRGLTPNTTYQWEIRSNCGGEITQGVRGPRFTTASLFESSSGNVSGAFASETEGIRIIPNPVKSVSTIIFTAARPGSYTLQLTNISGKVLFVKEGTTTIGENRIIINMSMFAGGTYFISLTDSENGKRSFKLVKE